MPSNEIRLQQHAECHGFVDGYDVMILQLVVT